MVTRAHGAGPGNEGTVMPGWGEPTPSAPEGDDRGAAADRHAAAPGTPPGAASALAPSVDPTADYRFWLVPHTHWDREWYLPFEQFRIRLARTVDEILDTLDNDPSFPCFTLDGQAVILEDYLELRPHREPQLRRLIAAGRLAIGPAYTLPDEFLVGGESLVRNLLHGRLVCRRFGGQPMAVGYLPDTFGHVAQLPQLLRGFGLDTFVFWRGLGDEADELGAVFTWQAPDGSEVLAIRQLGSYGNADEFGRWGRQGADFRDAPERWGEIAGLRLERFLEMFGPAVERAGIRDLLLCNGSDHKPVQRELPGLVAAARAVHPGAGLRIATYEDYVAALRPTVGSPAVLTGELRSGREAAILRGIESARIGLKQANEATERALFVAEALASLAELRRWADRMARAAGQVEAATDSRGPSPEAGRDGRDRTGLLGSDDQDGIRRDWGTPPPPDSYPLDELRHAWRELLRNHPHDSISGCSVDETHRDMAQRFVTAQRIAGRVRRESLARLAGRDAPWSAAEAPSADASIVNVLPFQRTALVELPLPVELARSGRLIAELDGGPVPTQVVGRGAAGRALVAATVPGFGSVGLRLRTARPAPDGARLVDGRTIENEHYRVTVEPDGTLAVTDLADGRRTAGLHAFEDIADRGDEYDFCPVAGDIAWRSERDAEDVRVRPLAAGPAVAELEIRLRASLPHGLSRDRRGRSRSRIVVPIRTLVRLVAGVDRIEFRTTVDNRVRDHRLRVVFPAPASGTTVRAEGQFDVVRRPAVPLWSGEGWAEPPAPTSHTAGAIAAGRLTVLGRGLPEYQAVLRADGGLDLALTLLRCVGWLSRDDLETRPGHAGPALETPEAQCLGEHVFEYAIDLRAAERDDAALLRASQDFRVELAVGPAGARTAGLLDLAAAGAAGDLILAALKGAEDGEGLILRAFAPADAETPRHFGPVGAFPDAEPVRLDETAMPAAAGDRRGLELAPGAIGTLRLRPPAVARRSPRRRSADRD